MAFSTSSTPTTELGQKIDQTYKGLCKLLHEKIDKLDSEKLVQNQKLEEQLEEICSLKAQLEKAKENEEIVEKLSSENQAMTQELQTTKQKLVALTQRQLELETEISQLKNKAQLQKDKEGESETLKAQLESAKKKVKTLTSDKQALAQDTLQKTKQIIGALTQRQIVLEKESKRLTNEVQSKKDSMETYNLEVKRLEEEQVTTDQQLLDCRAELASMEMEQVKYQQELRALQNTSQPCSLLRSLLKPGGPMTPVSDQLATLPSSSKRSYAEPDNGTSNEPEPCSSEPDPRMPSLVLNPGSGTSLALGQCPPSPVADDSVTTALRNFVLQVKGVHNHTSPDINILCKQIEQHAAKRTPDNQKDLQKVQCPFCGFATRSYFKAHVLTIHPERFLLAVKFTGVSLEHFREYSKQLILNAMDNCVLVQRSKHSVTLQCCFCEIQRTSDVLKQHLFSRHFQKLIQELVQLQTELGHHNDPDPQIRLETVTAAVDLIGEKRGMNSELCKFLASLKSWRIGNGIQCKYCTEQYPKEQISELYAHLGNHHVQQIYSMLFVKGSVSSSTDLERILELEANQSGDQVLQCNHCDCQFVQTGYLKLHLVLYHVDTFRNLAMRSWKNTPAPTRIINTFKAAPDEGLTASSSYAVEVVETENESAAFSLNVQSFTPETQMESTILFQQSVGDNSNGAILTVVLEDA